MVIPALNNSLSHPSFSTDSQPRLSPSLGASAGSARSDDPVMVSDRGRRLLEAALSQNVPSQSVYRVVPVAERPTPEQSAETILGFIDQHMQRLALDGADQKKMEKALGQALEGFKRGLAEAREILSGFELLTEDVAAGIDVTEQLVLDGLEQLRKNYMPEAVDTAGPTAPEFEVSRVVQAYSEQSYELSSYAEQRNSRNPISSLAASYQESYQRNQRVDLALKTRDGDVIELSFSAAQASSNSSQFAATGNSSGTRAILAYQRNSSESSNFSFSIRGELDAGELEALNDLLRQVGDLSDEFFNGDFDAALAMAMEVEMDGSEFSAMSLDFARSTRATLLESYVVAETGADRAASSRQSLMEQLKVMQEQAARFAEPELLLTQLLANQMAQQSLLAQQALVDRV
jgi:hypothetical protein